MTLALVAVTGGSAAAQTRMPVSYQARPLTLPRGTLRPDVGFNLASYPGPGERHERFYTYFGLGAGVTSDFELGALVVPLELAPDFDYGDGGVGLPPAVTPWFGHNRPEIYGRYRFVDEEVVEIGVDLRLVLPAPDPFFLIVGVPFLFHAGDIVRIDTGFHLATDFDDRTNAFLPFVLSFNPTERFFLGLDSGLWVRGPDVPLGFFVGGTLGRPLVDLKGGVRMVDAEHGFRTWQIWFTADFFVFL